MKTMMPQGMTEMIWKLTDIKL